MKLTMYIITAVMIMSLMPVMNAATQEQSAVPCLPLPDINPNAIIQWVDCNMNISGCGTPFSPIETVFWAVCVVLHII